MSSTPGSPARPPKTPRPWPVPRVRAPAPEELTARWAAGEQTPWADPVDESATTVADGAPASCGSTVGESTGRLRWTFCVEAPEAGAVLLWVNRLSDETALESTLLEQVRGTPLWAASFLMPEDWRASYCFLVAADAENPPWRQGDQVALRTSLDRGERDLRNPHTSRNRAGVEQSVVEGTSAPALWEATDLGREVPAPGWERRVVRVADRDVVLHQPLDASPQLPLVIVLDGEVWETHQGLPATFERLVDEGRTRPQRLVLVPSGGRDQRWSELAGARGGFEGWLVDALLPTLAEIGEAVAPGDVTVVGQSLGGLTALRAALLRPDAVGWCLSQSASTWVEDLTTAARGWTTPRGAGGLHLSVGAQEWVLTPGHLALSGALNDPVDHERAGSVEIVSHQGGHDYAWWRHALVDALLWQEQERRAGTANRRPGGVA